MIRLQHIWWRNEMYVRAVGYIVAGRSTKNSESDFNEKESIVLNIEEKEKFNNALYINTRLYLYLSILYISNIWRRIRR
jgi:hypothetical protein